MFFSPPNFIWIHLNVKWIIIKFAGHWDKSKKLYNRGSRVYFCHLRVRMSPGDFSMQRNHLKNVFEKSWFVFMLFLGGGGEHLIQNKHTIKDQIWSISKKSPVFQVKKRAKKKRKRATVKEKKKGDRRARAAAVCGRIRVVSGERGKLRRSEALMDKGDWNICNGLLYRPRLCT